MKNCSPQNVRNFVLAGHAGAGKTTLVDQIVFKAGAVGRLGSVDQRTSVSDFRNEEHDRGCSIYSSVLNCAYKDHHFYIVDTPGYQDFCGEAVAAMQVADMIVIVVNASSGIEPGTIRAWKMGKEKGIPRAFFINGLDRDQADFKKVLSELQEAYGPTTVIPFTLPIGEKASLTAVSRVLGTGEAPAEVAGLVSKYREALMDAVAESDEELMMRYLDGEELSDEEISKGLHKAIQSSTIVPVYVGSAAADIGVEEFMNAVCNLFPNPLARTIPLMDGELQPTADAGHGIAQVFKSVTDPFIGQLTFLRVFSGVLNADGEAHNMTRNGKERFGSFLAINGKDQENVSTAGPGEIIAIPKLKDTHVSDTLSIKSTSKRLPLLQFPKPTISCAVTAEKKGEEEKIGNGLNRLAEEDPTIQLERNMETHQLLLSGMGDQHLNNVVKRLESSFKVAVHLETPKVPYRETITASGTGVYRHKKQTGGHGQFAEVHLRVEPLAEQEFEFANEVVGGNVPRNFIPAIEKGIVENLPKGPLAHCRIINLKAVVFDGKFHPVDSSEMAFKIASRGALREAIRQAKPILLEPIMKLKIMFPDEYMGDISGDLNSRRGRILGMDREEGFQIVYADVPLAEAFTYSTQLRSITQGRGSFEMNFERYEQVPATLSQQIQAAVAREEEEE